MYTRRDYLYARCSFDQYYGQFITPEVIQYVDTRIGHDNIINSEDENFNDIKLIYWDKIVYNLKPLVDDQLLTEAQEGWSMSTGVCIAKMAAKLIRRMSQNAFGYR